MGGIRSTVVTPADDPARFSRHAVGWIPWVDHWTHPEELVQNLLDFARGSAVPPVLYFQSDGDLLVVSRYRRELDEAFRFVLADEALVESLVDKARFARLATDQGLPVPPTVVLEPGQLPAAELAELRFPVLVKPWTRQGLVQLGAAGKAVRVEHPQDLSAVWRSAGLSRTGLVVQELVQGPETRVESYHAYVGNDGSVVAEFTGVKVRTHPREFGHSTVLATSDREDVRRAGRDVVQRLKLTGVVKVDYKRDGTGSLLLLEVNPRFSLWQHVGAAAGLNLAALVHADLSGEPRPDVGQARPGVVWCDPVRDLRGVAAREVSIREWLRTVRTCEARSGATPGDLHPLLRGRIAGGIARRVARLDVRRQA